ncbi:MAG: HAD family hydrolase [Legionella sp.]
MNKPYHLVVFDWEGTLGDTLGHVIHALNEQALHLNIGPADEKQARHYLVFGLLLTIKKMFPCLKESQQKELLQAVQESIASNSSDIYLFPGARDLVKRLHCQGFDMAIATNKGSHSLLRALQHTRLSSFFHVTRSAGQTPAKPCPQMLEEIMYICNVSASQTLMVGDTTADMDMAAALGVDAIGVNFYNQPENVQQLLAAGAKFVMDDFQQLADFLQLLPA